MADVTREAGDTRHAGHVQLELIMKVLWIIFGLLLAACGVSEPRIDASVGRPDATTRSCTSRADCGSSEICYGGVCTEASAEYVRCDATVDCGGDADQWVCI